jgi:glycosyltransferase involved in cell wall biosynthesis
MERSEAENLVADQKPDSFRARRIGVINGCVSCLSSAEAGVMEKPLISLVMPLRNCAATIEQALNSVLDQGVPVELLVIDGASTDGTVEILERYAHHFTYYQSRPDDGPLDASEEGWARASGDIVMVLCGDDWLSPGSLLKISEAFATDPFLDVLSCGATIVTFNAKGQELSREIFDQPNQLGFAAADILRLPLTGSRILTRRLYDRVGAFDRRFPIATDLDYLLRTVALQPKCAILTNIVYNHRHHPGSRTMGDGWDLKRPLLEEDLTIIETRLDDAEWNNADRAALRAFHSDRARWLVFGLAARGEFRQAVAVTRRACQVNPAWPVSMIRHVLARAKGALLSP